MEMNVFFTKKFSIFIFIITDYHYLDQSFHS
jgi:hypothetical protein